MAGEFESAKPTGPVIDSTTITSLTTVVFILQLAYFASRRFLADNTPGKLRVLFIWHVFDALIHFFFEGSFLYNCLFISVPLSSTTHTTHPPNTFHGLPQYLSQLLSFISPDFFPATAPDHVYGARYGTGVTSLLWQEYAKADARWGEADLTVISLEILTVVIGGPLAVWCAYAIARKRLDAGFWMTVLAVGEIYGGFMTFAPEWLLGSPSLDASNFMYFWLYLMFFNLLWVAFPLMAIYVFYEDMTNAFKMRNAVYAASVRAKAETERIKTGKK